MRLINTTTFKLEEFIDNDVPPYAILSHTWAKEEASFQEMQGCDEIVRKKEGYNKIKQCCEIAKSDGFNHAWIDTCCIDKTSSSELSEAINSMYRWYSTADVCYVYLSDVPSAGDPKADGSDFSRSRWFTRGGSTEKASIAQRMSWAANRETTRPEDLAYSLMGLFHVYMPMIYGEGGEHAFLRLQEEILKISDDESIFAWTSSRYSGLLAVSPAAFSQSGHIFASKKQPNSKSFTFSNKGIRIELPMKTISVRDERSEERFHGVLNCVESSGSTAMVGIELVASAFEKDVFYRTSTSSLFSVETSEVVNLRTRKVYVEQSRSTTQGRKCGRYLIKDTPLLRANGILLASGAYDPDGPGLRFRGFRFFSRRSRSKSDKIYRACHKVGDELQFSISNPGRTVDWIIGAIRFEFGRQQDSFVVLLKKEMLSTSIEIGTPLIGESLEDVALSYGIGRRAPKSTGESSRRRWKNESDQLIWNLPSRSESILVTTRKQIVSGESTIVITVDLIK
ncbi:heterokaryon incompatibility protein-domain-containing protein [Hyaloscypha finlandica]|nr:heterokaryon incompatibility protein-domain-containing protein [Hyaloscypha finlandica]